MSNETTSLIALIQQLPKQSTPVKTLSYFEELLNAAINAFSHQDEEDKNKLIQLYRALDELAETKTTKGTFTTNERLQKGYEQLQKAEASIVFQKGLGRLQEIRKEIWSQQSG